jgi:hypothetical protein
VCRTARAVTLLFSVCPSRRFEKSALRGSAIAARKGDRREWREEKLFAARCLLDQPLAFAFALLWQGRPRAAIDLSLALAAFGSALADFVAWVALADYVDSPAAAHDLAVGMTKLKSTDRRYDFHGSRLQLVLDTAGNDFLARKARKRSLGSLRELRILGNCPIYATPVCLGAPKNCQSHPSLGIHAPESFS